MKRLQKKKTEILVELLRFIVHGDYSDRTKRHAKGLLLALLDI